MIDTDEYNPSTAPNSYTKLTIMNAKDKEVCEETNYTIAKVYTQDLKIKHEDRFLLSFTTMSNLADIKRKNPDDIFTSQMIIPPNQTILSGFNRLLENTLSQISKNIDIIIFGGSVCVDEISEKVVPYDYENSKEPIDLPFVVGNIIHKIYPTNVRISHFGYNENYKEMLEIKDYALLKNDATKVFNILDNINIVNDDTRYEYDLRYLCNAMFSIISKAKLSRVEFLVKYKITDKDDFNSFKDATEKYGYSVVLENNKLIVTKN